MKTYSVRFSHSGNEANISHDALRAAVVDFLERWGTRFYLGPDFGTLLGHGDRFANLLRACGKDEAAFFQEVLHQLAQAHHQMDDREGPEVRVSGIVLPKRLLLVFLEQMLPGDGFVAVRSVEQYAELTNTVVPEEQREDLQQVIDTYPVRLSRHVLRQSRLSRHVAYQFMPFVQELDQTGLKNTWIGQFHQGLLEQMYQNRPIFVLHMSCPVYCRFCFRKHKDCRNLPAPTVEDVQKAVEHIAASPQIKEIVLTGGEPLMNKATLTTAVAGLAGIPHVQTIRIASRCISYYPSLFFAENEFWLNYLINQNRELQKTNKKIEIATHFIHPDEISHYSLEIISRLVKGGVGVYTQTPFLKDCNDTGAELAELYAQLRAVGSELHYIYIPCSPIQGNNIYWTPISAGHAALAHLRGHLPDRAMPILCTATKIGKIDWNTSGWAVEQSGEEPDMIWIRTPYTEGYFKSFAPRFSLEKSRVNREETLDSRFMAQIGDESLFFGHLSQSAPPVRDFDPEELGRVQQLICRDQRIRQSIVPTGIEALQRVHRTQVEVDVSANRDMDDILEYIRANPEISDVVLAAEDKILNHLPEVQAYARALRSLPQVTALRVRSLMFAYEPEAFTDDVIAELIALNHLDPARPTRLELETQFVHSSEFRLVHGEIIRRLLANGVTVYNNIALLSGINDSPEEMKRICYNCRQIGIELQNLYVAGLPVQEEWNRDRPVEATTVIDLATHLRRHESGREVPLYVVRTLLGDADFNLNARIVVANADHVLMRLLCVTKKAMRDIDPDFDWPEGVTEQDGHPVVPVRGLTARTNRDFFMRG
ncbi:radical SAM protein [Desulfonatronum thiodismutans]|uniref:radical SAM protein n=2 Tax=Desulfonatronum TaxID=66848 RepID=UPI0004ABD5AA|nr:radical SAM protein [Desulfonatronum thiodismutans]